jgi:hypothetical protein
MMQVEALVVCFKALSQDFMERLREATDVSDRIAGLRVITGPKYEGYESAGKSKR